MVWGGGEGRLSSWLGLDREQPLSVGPRCFSCTSVSSPGARVPSQPRKSLLLWAELKKAMAQEPGGLRTLAEAFPAWEAASRWSRALEEVEESSRPYLKEVQRYEKYRCPGTLGGGGGQPSLSATLGPISSSHQLLIMLSLCLPLSQDPLLRGPPCPHFGCVPLGSELGNPIGAEGPQEVSTSHF